jgi:hypothetical protein
MTLAGVTTGATATTIVTTGTAASVTVPMMPDRTLVAARTLAVRNQKPPRVIAMTSDGPSGTSIRASSVPAMSLCVISIRLGGASEKSCTIRASATTPCAAQTRTLSTVRAFRVVPARDLRDHSGPEADPRSGDLRHLREQGLISTTRLDGRRDVAVVLTDRGRELLESHRGRDQDPR